MRAASRIISEAVDRVSAGRVPQCEDGLCGHDSVQSSVFSRPRLLSASSVLLCLEAVRVVCSEKIDGPLDARAIPANHHVSVPR